MCRVVLRTKIRVGLPYNELLDIRIYRVQGPYNEVLSYYIISHTSPLK